MKFVKRRAAFGLGAFSMIPTGPAIMIASPVGQLTSIGLPWVFFASD